MRYVDEEQTTIAVDNPNGTVSFVPVNPLNKDYIRILEEGQAIEDYVPPVIPNFKGLTRALEVAQPFSNWFDSLSRLEQLVFFEALNTGDRLNEYLNELNQRSPIPNQVIAAIRGAANANNIEIEII